MLKWSPLIDAIEANSSSRGKLLYLISPFIQLGALRKTLEVCESAEDLIVITRWTAADILSGVSDIEIYPYLKGRKHRLYINSSIHLKLFVFNDNNVFHCSGNITSKGLGIIESGANIEVGVFGKLELDDWKHLYLLINNSFCVTDKIYEKAVMYYEKYKKEKEQLPPLNLSVRDERTPYVVPFNYCSKSFLEPENPFSINSLPAVQTPEKLYELYKDGNPFMQEDKELSIKLVHDLILFEIPLNLQGKEFYDTLKVNFMRNQFISQLLSYIEANAPLRFGTITQWVHENCYDSPMPFRSDIKKYVSILYNWIPFFVKEASWDVPGRESQVMYWKRIK